MSAPSIDAARLLGRLRDLGDIGRDGEGRLTRLAASDTDDERLQQEEAALAAFLDRLAVEEGVAVSVERLARFEPVAFDAGIVAEIESAARARRLSCRRMTSGAGHDAQMIARITPAAMIFVPSKDGVSHNPKELTADDDLVAGANILLDVARKLTERE